MIFVVILLSIISIYPKNIVSNINCVNGDTLVEKSNWELFLKENYFSKLYIVFAGPYPQSPTSSFGHIFLVLEPVNKRPLLLWPTIDFSANSDNMDSFEFFIQGIFGELNGRYRIEPFYEKYRQYTFIESRPLWLFPLRLSDDEKNNLLLNIFNQQEKDHPYTFSRKNCASQIDALLRTALGMEIVTNRVIYYPKTILSNWDDKIEAPMFIESMNNLIAEFYEVSNIDLSSEHYELEKLTEAEKALLLKSLEWKYAHQNEHLNEERTEFIKKLRLIVAKAEPNQISNFSKYKRDFKLHPSMLIGSGLKYSKDKTVEYLINYRFGLHEFYENTSVYPANDYLSLFKIEMGFRDNKIMLNKLFLFDQLSLQPITSYSKYLSWRIGLGIERMTEYDNRPIVYGLFNGIGYTVPILEDRLNLSLLMNVSPVFTQYNGFTILYGPEFIFQLNVSDNIKIMNKFETTLSTKEALKFVYSNETNIGFGIGDEFILLLQYDYAEYENGYTLRLNYYLD
ncbi:MAG: DUF4105 domain-containing protein [Ignavibacteriaceae bacterium]